MSELSPYLEGKQEYGQKKVAQDIMNKTPGYHRHILLKMPFKRMKAFFFIFRFFQLENFQIFFCTKTSQLSKNDIFKK